MNLIKVNSASAGCFLVLSIIFIIGSVRTISIHLHKDILERLPLGTFLLILSVASLLTALTSSSPRKIPFVQICLCIGSYWFSIGLTNIWMQIDNTVNITGDPDVSLNEVMMPGYSGFLLVFVSFFLVSLTNRSFKSITILSAVCALWFIFEIIDVYVGLGGTEIVLIILGMFFAYFWLYYIVENYRSTNKVASSEVLNKNNSAVDLSNYSMLQYALNVVCFAAFANAVVNITSYTRFSFPWLIASGVFQTISGISALRNKHPYKVTDTILQGIFWLAIGSSLLVENVLQKNLGVPVPVCSALIVLFLILFGTDFRDELFISINHVVFAIFVLSLCVVGLEGIFVGVMGWIGIIFSTYGLLAITSEAMDSPYKLPVGKEILKQKKINMLLTHLTTSNRQEDDFNKNTKERFSSDVMMGSSKYIDAQCIGFAVNGIAAFSLVWVPSDSNLYILPWVLGFGGLIQFVVGFVSFSRGLTFESCSFLLYASFWSIWGTIRSLSVFDDSHGPSLMVGCISFLVVGILFLGLSTTVSKIWFAMSLLFNCLVLAFILRSLNVPNVNVYEIVVSLAYVLVFTYAFFASLTKKAWGRDVLPVGKPILHISKIHSDMSKAFLTDPRRASGVKTIAEILRNGGICGIPTDTVYVLVAACNKPEAVQRAYNTKKLAEDRPMSVWISNISQIQSARVELGELCWNFMHRIWPSNISCVVNKGEWVKSLGLGDAQRLVGKPDSVAIRIPDNTIVCHLIDQTGPIAVTSANPTGEADTTHHMQVLAKLGTANCDGILADGPSPENIASTVVNCKNIKDGKIGFFRVGLTPKSVVEEHLYEAKLLTEENTCDRSESCIIRETDDENGSHVNKAFHVQEQNISNATALYTKPLTTSASQLINSAMSIRGQSRPLPEFKTNPIFHDDKKAD